MAEIDQPLALDDAISTSSSGDKIETGLLSSLAGVATTSLGSSPPLLVDLEGGEFQWAGLGRST